MVRHPEQGHLPKWKTFLATWGAVCSTLLPVSTLIEQAAGGRLPIPIQLARSSLLLTAVLTWLIMPAHPRPAPVATRLCARLRT